MQLPIKLVTLKKPRKDGNFLIYFQYCYSSTSRILLGTNISIPGNYWNKKRQSISKSLPPSFGNADTLNLELHRQRKVLEALIDKGTAAKVDDILLFIKEQFSPTMQLEMVNSSGVSTILKTDFFVQLDEYINSMEKIVSPLTVATIKGMRGHLIAYQNHRKIKITFDKLDYNFYVDLIEFLTFEYRHLRKKNEIYGLKTNTIGKTIKKLRMFAKDRVRRKIIPPLDISEFKILDEESDAIYLSMTEIEKIYNLDLTAHTNLIKDRDLFVLGCLTGLRYSDYSTLTKNDYRNGYLQKKTDKLDAWVLIPLRTEALLIFQKYFVQDSIKFSNPVFNRNIKTIARMAGINEIITFSHKKGNKQIMETKEKAEWVTSHTCRRSFATNEFLLGTEVSLIMKITGHKTFKEFFKYIRINELDAARKIQEIWTTRNNMSAFLTTKVV